MRAITLTQPWAQLVALGEKRMETRSWTTSYRGPLAIHAGATLGPVGGAQGLAALIRTEPFQSTLRGHGIVSATQLAYGAIVAVADLVDVVRTGEAWSFEIDSRELAFGDYTPGRYAWALENVRTLVSPLPCKGKLGLWVPPTLGWYDPDADPIADIADVPRWSVVDGEGQVLDIARVEEAGGRRASGR